jgi:4-alpha-glucanotransferase
MYVQLFEFTGDAEQPAKTPPRESIASFSTHDLPTFAAYWTDADLEERQRIGLMDAETEQRTMSERLLEKKALAAHLRGRGLIGDEASEVDVYRGATRLLAESEARRVLLNLEDLWGETRAQNLPGTMADQHANWTHRARYALEELSSIDDITSTLAMMRKTRPRSSGEAQGGEDKAG